MDLRFNWNIPQTKIRTIYGKLSIFDTLTKAPDPDQFISKSPILSEDNHQSGTKWFLELASGKNFDIQLKLCLSDSETFNLLDVSYKIDLTSSTIKYFSVEGKTIFGSKSNYCTCFEKLLNGHHFKNIILTYYNSSSILTFECTLQIHTRASTKFFHQLQTDYEKLFSDAKYSDFKLVARGKKFNVHKSILAARSEVFSAMFELDMKEKKEGFVEIEEFDEQTVQELLRYMYCGKIENLEKLAKNLLLAADKYLLQDLKMICLEELCKNISIDNAEEILLLVDNHGIEHLRLEIMDFIVKNIKSVIDKSNLKTINNMKLLHEILCKTVKKYV